MGNTHTSNIYCGNNALEPTLLDGSKRIGTRRECFRIGVGRGIHLPYDPKYNGPHQPINDENIYCGDGPLPANRTRNGSIPSCLQKGIGIGKSIKARRGFPYKSYGIILIIFIVLFIALQYLPIDFLKKKDEYDNIIGINWLNFMIVYVVSCFVIFIISLNHL